MTPAAFAWHAALLQEPWCMTPAQVARLTPWQAEHLYVRPAVERAGPTGGGAATGGGESPPGHDWSRGLPDRASFAAGMAAAFGGGVREWEADWDRMRAAEGGRDG